MAIYGHRSGGFSRPSGPTASGWCYARTDHLIALTMAILGCTPATEEEQHAAATKIQCMKRGKDARHKVETKRKGASFVYTPPCYELIQNYYLSDKCNEVTKTQGQ